MFSDQNFNESPLFLVKKMYNLINKSVVIFWLTYLIKVIPKHYKQPVMWLCFIQSRFQTLNMEEQDYTSAKMVLCSKVTIRQNVTLEIGQDKRLVVS